MAKVIELMLSVFYRTISKLDRCEEPRMYENSCSVSWTDTSTTFCLVSVVEGCNIEAFTE